MLVHDLQEMEHHGRNNDEVDEEDSLDGELDALTLDVHIAARVLEELFRERDVLLDVRVDLPTHVDLHEAHHDGTASTVPKLGDDGQIVEAVESRCEVGFIVHLNGKEDAQADHGEDQLHTLKVLFEPRRQDGQDDFLSEDDELPVEVGLGDVLRADAHQGSPADDWVNQSGKEALLERLAAYLEA